MTDAAKLISNWADNAMAAMGAVPDMAVWVVENGHRLHDLEQLAPAKRRELQGAIAARWSVIEAERERIRQGIG